MTEEVNKTEVKTEDAGKKADEDTKVQEQPKYTPVQERAIEQGWRPKDQFDGAEELFIDAAEFLRRGELFGKIEQQRKEMSELRKTVRAQQTHFEKVREVEFNRALDLLKKQKVEALKEGEPERVVEIESQMDEVKDQIALTKANAEREKIRDVQEQTVDPRFTAWVDKNKWYAQNVELKEFADSVGIAYTKSRPGIDPAEVLKYVEGRVKVAYPERFKNPNRERANAVETGDGTRSNTSKKSSAEDYVMTPEEETVFKTLHRSDPKKWTREKYVADLKDFDARRK